MIFLEKVGGLWFLASEKGRYGTGGWFESFQPWRESTTEWANDDPPGLYEFELLISAVGS